MKNIFLITIILTWILLAGCAAQATAIPAASPLPATPTPEVFISLTQAIPAQLYLGEVTLSVQNAEFTDCEIPGCPPAPSGRRYLRVTLQALNLPADQSLDYKNLPAGIAVHDDTGDVSPFDRQVAYAPARQQLALYFAVSETAEAFGLQWPGAAEIPLTVTTPAVQPPSAAGTEVTYGPLTLVIPPEVADGASGGEIAPVTDDEAAWWQKTPGHWQIDLKDYYVLQGKSRRPVINIYPAQAYAELLPLVFESIHRLNNILNDPNAPLAAGQLPALPFFNENQAFAAHIQVISFQNGRGVRFLTEYAQYPVSANNADLFYEFQGLSNDGAYYIVAILPITLPLLAESADGGAVLPPGGIPYKYFAEGINFDAQGYYTEISDLLNHADPGSFTPTIGQLDALIQSMQIAP